MTRGSLSAEADAWRSTEAEALGLGSAEADALAFGGGAWRRAETLEGSGARRRP